MPRWCPRRCLHRIARCACVDSTDVCTARIAACICACIRTCVGRTGIGCAARDHLEGAGGRGLVACIRGAGVVIGADACWARACAAAVAHIVVGAERSVVANEAACCGRERCCGGRGCADHAVVARIALAVREQTPLTSTRGERVGAGIGGLVAASVVQVSASLQSRAAPPQAPAASHASPVVQKDPSSQAVPAARGV